MKIITPMTRRALAYLISVILAMTAIGSVAVYAAVSNASTRTVDFEITTTAKSVSSDQPTTVTIVVRASS
jgi:hypothetical protein